MVITADNNTLYATEPDFSPQEIYRFDVTTDTPVKNAQGPWGRVSGTTLAVRGDGSMLYTSCQQAWSADLSTQVGTFAACGRELEYVPAIERLFVTVGLNVVEVNALDFSVVASFPLPGTAVGVARADRAGATLYVSTDAGLMALDLTAVGGARPTRAPIRRAPGR